jgi:Family of unknown function (DUF6159)
MSRMSRGFQLARASWEVLKTDRSLVWLPVLSFLAMAALSGVYVLGLWGLGSPGSGGFHPSPWAFVPLYFVISFVGIFANAAIVGAATMRLRGGQPTLADGLRMAVDRLPKIVGWAALTTTVGLVIRAFEERAGFLSRLVLSLVGAAWNVVTFFVVPVLLFEDLGVTDSVRRSATLFRSRWGEQFVGNASIGIAMLVVALPVVLVGGALAAAVPLLGVPLLVLALGALMAVGSALSGIFNAALYQYAVAGDAIGPFTADDLGGAFRPRR